MQYKQTFVLVDITSAKNAQFVEEARERCKAVDVLVAADAV